MAQAAGTIHAARVVSKGHGCVFHTCPGVYRTVARRIQAGCCLFDCRSCRQFAEGWAMMFDLSDNYVRLPNDRINSPTCSCVRDSGVACLRTSHLQFAATRFHDDEILSRVPKIRLGIYNR
jgi:hypothetical protein